jgi:hypothetical protein
MLWDNFKRTGDGWTHMTQTRDGDVNITDVQRTGASRM